LTVQQRLQLMISVVDAIQHAHQKGLIHRDLKPSNILVASNGDEPPVVKVIDFGVAKALQPISSERLFITGNSQLIGTPMFMSPEQADGNMDVDTRSDIYSLGVILYELLTGATPIDVARLMNTDWLAVRQLIQEVDPPRPSTRLVGADAETRASLRGCSAPRLSKQLAGELDWIVMKCLEKDRSRRYPSASELNIDLKRFLNGDPVEAGPPSTSYRLRKLAKKHRKALAVAAGVSLLLVAATAVSGWMAARAGRAEAKAKIDRDAALTAQSVAEQESSISRAVTEFFLQDLLAQANIANQTEVGQRDPNITVRELLDRAADRLRGKFTDKPRTEAAILTTLGRSYAGVGELEAAETHLSRSADLLDRTLGSDHIDSIRSRQALGWLLLERGKAAEAESIFQRVVEHHQQLFGPSDSRTLSAMNMLGAAYKSLGRFADSEKTLTAVLNSRRKQFGDNHLDTIESINNLGVLYASRGRYEEAEKYVRQAMEGWSEILGDDHPKSIGALNGLAAAILMQQRYADAEPLLDKGNELSRKKLGPNHPERLSFLNNLAILYSETNRVDKAGELYEQVLKLRRDKLGNDDPATWDAMTNLAIYFAENGQSQKALEMFQSVLDVQRKSLGAKHPDTISSLNNLAYFYQTLGQNREAEPLLREAVDAAKETLGIEHRQFAVIANNLAKLQIELEQPKDAEPLIRELVQVQERIHGENSTDYVVQLAWLALCLLEQDRFEEAEKLARTNLEIRNRNNQDTWPKYYALGLLGAALSGQHRFGEAEPLLLESYAGLKDRRAQIPIDSRFVLNYMLEMLIDHYMAAGKTTEAEKYQADLSKAQE
jgi:non-specific serine/threonine protein kinase/serine/threonine-protein kinase